MKTSGSLPEDAEQMDKKPNKEPQSIRDVKKNDKETLNELYEEEEYQDDDFEDNDELEDCESAAVAAADRVIGHKCDWEECIQKFEFVEELANHVNDDHVKILKDEEYKCAWRGCTRKGRGFNARYKMLIHVRTHTNERPHRCTQCGKCFSRLENLKIHNRSHTGERPYMCPISGCGKAYSNSSDRFKHTRTHFEEKPYICKMDGCNKRYTDPSSLRKHMKTYGHYRQGQVSNVPDASSQGDTRPFFSSLPQQLVTFEFSTLSSDKVLETRSPSVCLELISGASNISDDETTPLDLTMGHAVTAENNYSNTKWGIVTSD